MEREIGAICRKVAKRVAEGREGRALIVPQSIAKYLGPPRFTRGIAEEQDEIGVATGVAYTPSGGDILSIEVALMRGKGNLMLTGQLGEVMKESAQAALSYSRARSEEWHLKDGYFSTKDIHIHIPAGAMPKEGAVRRRRLDHGARFCADPQAGAQGRGNDRRNNAQRQGLARWRHQGESPGGSQSWHSFFHPPCGEPRGYKRYPKGTYAGISILFL